MENYQIAIDGPAGSGKSTISKILAKKIGFTHIDTGAMYRACTLASLRRGIDLEDANAYHFLEHEDIKYINDKIYLNNEDVTKEIRSKEVTDSVSIVAKHHTVRDLMVKIQQRVAKTGKIIMDGRDICTVVLKNANLKIFLDASIEVRAKRRFLENSNGMTLEELQEDIKRRDFLDSTRDYNPLVKAKDAITIDTSDMTIDDVVNKIIELVEETHMSDSNLMDQYLDSIERVYVGKDVKGTVIEVKDDFIILDLHTTIDGKMYINEYTKDKNAKFSDLVKVGDNIEARVNKIVEDGQSMAFLSRMHIVEEKNFKQVLEAYEDGEFITVKVIKVVNKGVICSYHGVDMFMHVSQCGTDDLDSLLNKELEVEILMADKRNHKVKCSHTQVLYKRERAKKNAEYKKMLEEREAEAETMEVGNVYKMQVVSVKDRYAILKYNLNTALLYISEVSHLRTNKVSDELQVGDELEVKIISNALKNGKRKIAVSRKALLDTPYLAYKKQHELGSVIEVTVEKKLPFGLICVLDEHVTGLLHVSEISYNPNDNTMASLVHGDKISVKIIKYNDKDEKISLSIKQLGENPWADIHLRKGDIVTATVKAIEPGKGLTCIVNGVDAFMDTRDVANVDHISKVEDYLHIGDEFQAKVVEVDYRRWYIQLSVKAMIQDQERKEFDNYYKNQEESVVTIGDLFGDKLKKIARKEDK